MSVPLFCLPYSGASASVYARWQAALPAWLSVRPLELPGRGARFAEPLATDLRTLARQLAQSVQSHTCQPYVVFGHSLGALLAVEMAYALRDLGAPAPALLLASGTEAPSTRQDEDWADPLPDAELVERLRNYGGTPPAVLESEELLALVLPILRADFLLCGRYQPPLREPLACPLQVFAGRQDSAAPAALQAWQRESSGSFALQWFDGGHFFINSSQQAVLERLVTCIREHLPQLPTATATES